MQNPQNYNSYNSQTSSSGKSCIFFSVGCLGICILACGGFLGLGYWGMKNVAAQFPIEETMRELRSHPEAITALGEPIQREIGFDVGTHTENGEQTSSVELKVYGPDGKGTVVADCHKDGETWVFDTLVLKLKNGEKIDLQRDLLEVAEEEFSIQLDE